MRWEISIILFLIAKDWWWTRELRSALEKDCMHWSLQGGIGEIGQSSTSCSISFSIWVTEERTFLVKLCQKKILCIGNSCLPVVAFGKWGKKRSKIITKSIIKIFPIDWKSFNNYKHLKGHSQSQASKFLNNFSWLLSLSSSDACIYLSRNPLRQRVKCYKLI